MSLSTTSMASVDNGPTTDLSDGYKTIQANFDKLVNALVPTVCEVARKAYRCNLITQQNLDDAENLMLSKDHRSSALLRLIQGKIRENEAHFQTFVSILREVPILKDLANDIADSQARTPLSSSSGELEDSSNCANSLSSASDVSCNIEDSPGISHQQTTNTSIEAWPSPLLWSPAGLSYSTNDSYQETDSTASSPAPFQCRCGKKCTVGLFVSGNCHQQSNNLFPYLKLEQLRQNDREKLVRKLTSEARKMADVFAELVVKTFRSLKERRVSFKDLRADVITFGRHKLPRPYSDDHVRELASASNPRDIQVFLEEHRYISFFNYGILQKIICLYGTDEDKQNLEEYLLKYSSFCKRSVFEVPSTMIDQHSPSSEVEDSLVVKINENQWFSNHGQKIGEKPFTIEDVYTVEEGIAKVIGLESEYILLCDIKKGCIELTFSFASDKKLLPLKPSQCEQLFHLGLNVIYKPMYDLQQVYAIFARQHTQLPGDFGTGSCDSLFSIGTSISSSRNSSIEDRTHASDTRYELALFQRDVDEGIDL